MGPIDEVSGSSAFTAASYAFLRRVVVSVAKRYNFPVRPGHAGWTPAAADEWISDVFWPKKGYEAVVTVQVQATDDSSAEALLRVVVHNLLRDEARATTTGKMLDRLNGLIAKQGDLAAGDACTGGTRSWTMPELGDAVYDGDWRDLLVAPVLRSLPPLGILNPAGPTSAANRDALNTAARLLVEAAGGAVRAADLARAVVQIYELDDPAIDTLEAETEGRFVTTSAAEAPGQRAEHVAAADFVWAQLELPEVLLLPHLDRSPALVKRLVPAVANPRQRLPDLQAKLRDLLKDQPDYDEVFGIVLARAEDFAQTH